MRPVTRSSSAGEIPSAASSSRRFCDFCSWRGEWMRQAESLSSKLVSSSGVSARADAVAKSATATTRAQLERSRLATPDRRIGYGTPKRSALSLKASSGRPRP
jgi:hypothetical protein